MDYLIKRDDLRDCHWADAPVTDLADGMARLRVDAFALTANNVTYATFGEAMKYWDFFPASSPEFGRVRALCTSAVSDGRPRKSTKAVRPRACMRSTWS